MKYLFIWIIKVYQKCISRFTVSKCRFYPTCSRYAVTAFDKHGAVKGLILSVWRIMRCNPWNNGGIDYVPEKFKLSVKNNHNRPVH